MTLRLLFRLAMLALALPLLAAPALAGDLTGRPRGVIELFTSQGCSTCPPADKLFEKFANDDSVVALAYHVDYWDYLGWRDTLSSPDSTDRQYAYMRAFGTRSVYTPQAVINGRVHVNGAKHADIAEALDRMNKSGEGLSVDVSLRQSGDGLLIEAGPAAPGAAHKAHLILVYFGPPQSVGMEVGENEGRTITYWNPVSDVQTAGVWRGEAMKYEIPIGNIAHNGGCAVLLQSVSKDGVPGPILGAAIYRRQAEQTQQIRD